jgi:hypothetical protein
MQARISPTEAARRREGRVKRISAACARVSQETGSVAYRAVLQCYLPQRHFDECGFL